MFGKACFTLIEIVEKPFFEGVSPWNLNVLPHHLPKYPKHMHGKVSSFLKRLTFSYQVLGGIFDCMLF